MKRKGRRECSVAAGQCGGFIYFVSREFCPQGLPGPHRLLLLATRPAVPGPCCLSRHSRLLKLWERVRHSRPHLTHLGRPYVPLSYQVPVRLCRILPARMTLPILSHDDGRSMTLTELAVLFHNQQLTHRPARCSRVDALPLLVVSSPFQPFHTCRLLVARRTKTAFS